jgi:hypothetical protein
MGGWIGLAALPTVTALPSGHPVKIVNRCAITVAPRQPFIDWAEQLQPDQPLPPGAFEPGLYLLPTYDDRQEAIELLAQGYEEIFCSELETWSSDLATWPSQRSLALFQEWFAFQFFDLVSDQALEPLTHHVVDESFLEDLRNAIEDSPLS